MKATNITLLAAAAVICQCAGTRSCNAQPLFKVLVNAVSTSTNSSGALVVKRFGNREIIKHCADEAGVTNLSDLSLVYDRGADALQVVSGTNQSVVCTPMSFDGGVSVGNAAGTRIERLAFVYLGTNQEASGTMEATEHLAYGTTNQLTRFTLNGRLQFAVAGDSNNAAAVYQGVIVANPGRIVKCEPPGHEAKKPEKKPAVVLRKKGKD